MQSRFGKHPVGLVARGLSLRPFPCTAVPCRAAWINVQTGRLVFTQCVTPRREALSC